MTDPILQRLARVKRVSFDLEASTDVYGDERLDWCHEQYHADLREVLEWVAVHAVKADPIKIELDQGPPTEPGEYLMQRSSGLQLVKVFPDRYPQLLVFIPGHPYTVPLDKIDARWSRRIAVE